MPGGNTTRRQFTIDDLNPHIARPEQAPRLLWRKDLGQKEKFARGAEGAGELQVFTHIAPFGQRAALVHPPNDPDAVLVAPKNTGLGAFAAGQGVLMGQTRSGITIIGEPPFGERGTSERPVQSVLGVVDLILVDRAEPNQLDPDTITVVTFFGTGFSSSPVDLLKAVIRDTTQFDSNGQPLFVDDTLITIGTVTYVSDTEITATVTVDAAKEVGLYLQVDYSRG